MIRFVHFFNYAKGISIEDGEAWYMNTHVPQVKKLGGIQRYHTWRALPPIPMLSPDPYDRFGRMSELGFKTLEDCQEATMDNPDLWTPSEEGVPGFGELECVFLEEEPQYDLMKHVPPQQYKYMGLPLKFSKGSRERIDIWFEDSDDVIINVYMFNYRVSALDGEDWYLGHHTREGKQMKQVGRRIYKTWRPIMVPEAPNSPLQPNRFYRITWLGLQAEMQIWPVTSDQPRSRILYTPSPLGDVIDEWRNILIDPSQVQDLLR